MTKKSGCFLVFFLSLFFNAVLPYALDINMDRRLESTYTYFPEHFVTWNECEQSLSSCSIDDANCTQEAQLACDNESTCVAFAPKIMAGDFYVLWYNGNYQSPNVSLFHLEKSLTSPLRWRRFLATPQICADTDVSFSLIIRECLSLLMAHSIILTSFANGNQCIESHTYGDVYWNLYVKNPDPTPAPSIDPCYDVFISYSNTRCSNSFEIYSSGAGWVDVDLAECKAQCKCESTVVYPVSNLQVYVPFSH